MIRVAVGLIRLRVAPTRSEAFLAYERVVVDPCASEASRDITPSSCRRVLLIARHGGLVRSQRRRNRRVEFGRNMMALGDFNIDRWLDDPNADAFRSEGLTPPFELLGLPRTIFDKPAKPHFYDQIAWFTTGNRAALTLSYEQQAGFVDWKPHLLGDLTDVAKSWRVSDHFPLWARFGLP